MAHRSGRGSGFIFAAAATLFALAPTSAWASAIQVSAGDTVVFTFDFTTLSSHQPPYPAMRVDTGIDLGSVDPGGGDRCRYTLYRDGNAVDRDVSFIPLCDIDFEAGTDDSGWLDGVLSIALSVLDGSVSLDPRAIALTEIGEHGVPLTPRVVPRVRVVAEPSAPLLLLILVVSIAVWLRHRRTTGRGLVPSTRG